MELKSGDNVVIAGGGPAGSLAAIILMDHASTMDLPLEVTVLEKKDFDKQGHGGCNSCAGVVSTQLVDDLSKMGIHIPEHVIQRYIDGYTVETPRESLSMTDANEHIVTVFRGNGPGRASYDESVSFDGFSKSEAEKRGAQFVNTTVTSITPPKSLEERVAITTKVSAKEGEVVYEADLLIGALGMPGVKIFEDAGFGYKKARTVRLAQTEIAMDPETIGDIFGKHVHVYYLDIPGIWHAAITPKREYITVSILSSGNSSRETSRSLRQKLDQFLNHDAITRKVTDRLPDDQAIADALERGMVLEPSCFCAPEMPYKDSVNPYGDRIAIIGDAAYSRLFKNGVESAFTTAEMAVKAALDHGVSREELKAHYHEPAARRFNDDNRYGRALFRIGGYSSRVRGMVDSHLRVAQTDSDNGRRLKDMYWSMSTAGKPYRDIFADVLHPGLLMEIGIASVRGVVPAYVRRR